MISYNGNMMFGIYFNPLSTSLQSTDFDHIVHFIDFAVFFTDFDQEK